MASPDRWRLRPAAQDDLAAIWRQGADLWGSDQADRYADAMFTLFDLLADFPEMARERPEFSPPVRIHPIEAHLVIYRVAAPGIEIIRVLHAHQNLIAFLQD